MNVAGSRSAKYFSLIRHFRARPGGQGDVVDLVDQDQIDASVRGDRADSVGDVGDVGASREFQAEEAGELDGQHAWCRRRWDGDVDDRQPIAVVGEAAADGQFVSPAQLSQRSGLTGARHAADHHAAAGGDLRRLSWISSRPVEITF